MVIIVGFKLLSTTILPNTASTNIKKKAINEIIGIHLFSFLNFVWYLFLEDPLGAPEIWESFDFKDEKYIESSSVDYTKWGEIKIPRFN